jgi:hypothetical protein
MSTLASTTADDITDFVKSLAVRVESCFEVQTRRPFWQRMANIVPDRKAFRLCVNRDDCDKLLIADCWPSDVTISAWRFKPKASGEPHHDQPDNQAAVASLSANTAVSAAVSAGINAMQNATEPTNDGDQTTIYDPESEQPLVTDPIWSNNHY